MKKRKGLSTFLLTMLLFNTVSGIVPQSTFAEEPQAVKLILDYDMNSIEGTTVKDNTGNFEGKLVNPENAELIKGTDAGAVSFKGGSTSSYIEMPQGVLNNLESVTVSSLVNWNGVNEAEWLFALGQDSNKYLFTTPKRNSGDRSARAGLGITSWMNEAGANATTGTLKSNEWKLVTTVVSGAEKTIKLYIDGVEVGSASTNGYTLAQINNVNGRSGFIGRSFYSADPYFGGMIADFKVFNGALTATEVGKLKEEADKKIAAMDGLLLKNAANQLDYSMFINQNKNNDEITSDLLFPKKGSFGTTITWESINQDIITNEGKVNRPSYEDGDQKVGIIATISDGTKTITKEFTVTVLKKPHDSVAVRMDAANLKVHNIEDVRGNLTLPKTGVQGSAITWKSSNPSIITPTGEVTRPGNGEGDKTVKLTATLTLNKETITKAFLAKVKEMPKKENYEGYVFSYFTGEGYSNGEQIYFALSEGNNPLKWKELNNGAPAITSNLGEKGLRDPFIVRSPEGDKFYLIATDLKINGDWNWDRAQRRGSRAIMVWESTDLINWSEQRMVEVSPKEAGNTWAPEVVYDETTGEYIVFWASILFGNEEHTDWTHNRIMYSKTRDFYTFTEPKVYMDPGYSVIDTTMIKHDGKVYRFTKDERNNSTSSPNGKFVFQEVGDSVFDPTFDLIKEGIGKGSIGAGEGPTIFKSNTEEKWYMFLDEFGGKGYVPFETTNLQSGEWKMSTDYKLPSRPRHGTVMPVTKREYEGLLSNVPKVKNPDSIQKITGVTVDKVRVELEQGKEEHLTATITPDDAVNKDVLWSSNNEEVATVDENGNVSALREGTAKITATTVDGGYIDVSVVTVKKDTTPPEIQFIGNAGTYPVDAKIEITCSAFDELSGVASVNCPSTVEHAYDFGVGVHKLSASAVDKAGNTAVVETEFTVTVDFDSLSRLTQTFVSKDVVGVADSLVTKLQSAKEAAARGNKQAVEGKVKAYVNELSAQIGKVITEQQSNILIFLSDKLYLK
ncbi:immunoglobulin-like domain-containing protein [Neobacillus bataviensis]|uniref:immunoglobulin-like domain-containing protein n=1 Tax=Neobacillus bataviensis TaxID=220685 RepID=UPI001CBAE186|nr:immunoglobulin-like domain-containing protein [Neobacillus bataviensis]